MEREQVLVLVVGLTKGIGVMASGAKNSVILRLVVVVVVLDCLKQLLLRLDVNIRVDLGILGFLVLFLRDLIRDVVMRKERLLLIILVVMGWLYRADFLVIVVVVVLEMILLLNQIWGLWVIFWVVLMLVLIMLMWLQLQMLRGDLLSLLEVLEGLVLRYNLGVVDR